MAFLPEILDLSISQLFPLLKPNAVLENFIISFLGGRQLCDNWYFHGRIQRYDAEMKWNAKILRLGFDLKAIDLKIL